MTTAKPVTRKSSRLGTRNYKAPPPLRFKSIKDARKYIKANGLRRVEHRTTPKGVYINVVSKEGRPRTLKIENEADTDKD